MHDTAENDYRKAPTYDFVGEHGSIDDFGDVERLLEDFINGVEDGYFLRWEAVERIERGLPLTPKQQEAMDDLIDFSDAPDQPIWYIDEIERPREPWHVILKQIATWLLLEQFRTAETHYACETEGWPDLYECIMDTENGLMLPKGTISPIDVVPLELQHKLWLQSCFESLEGIGQPTYLKDPEVIRLEDQQERVATFIEELRDHRDTVAYLDLTLENMLKVLIMPKQDEKLFVTLMSNSLGLESRRSSLSNGL